LDRNKTLIPGQNRLFSGSGEFSRCVLLLVGSSGSGKTVYGMQFIREGIANGDYCLYINCSQALSQERFNSFFADTPRTPDFLNLYSLQKTGKSKSGESIPAENNRTLSGLLEHVTNFLSSKNQSIPTRVVVDSLTDMIARFPDNEVQKFVAEFYDFLKTRNDTIALFTLTGTTLTPMVDVFGSLFDGIMQLRMEDTGEEIQRYIRIYSLKTAYNTPKWIIFKIAEGGALQFGRDNDVPKTEPQCKLCREPIIGPVIVEAESPFHPSCLGTYHKLGEIYGSNIIYSLQPGVVNTNFFFIDIVGLSDPLLSVENQIRKIEDLNVLIGSCEAFSKVPKDEKIILPTGDGMAIGYLMNPELPLQLSVQLHRKLRAFNAKKTSDKFMGVRIGLSSGPVFVVTDINNNQNVWGPGIILARRVMDLGESGHILLSENIAETLMNLKDEYREMIRPVSMGYTIKHGQSLKLYSAYSQEFGNPAVPARILELR
jgi:KaiC/GvpD/RAD55 family RecA-like ATPase